MSEAQPQLALERIYTKDISFEVPGAQVFTKEWQPELNINLSSSVSVGLSTLFMTRANSSSTAKPIKLFGSNKAETNQRIGGALLLWESKR